MEELSTLATGFEVDGGQLRFQLYIWLEKEVEVLRQLTNYGKDMEPLSRASSGMVLNFICVDILGQDSKIYWVPSLCCWPMSHNKHKCVTNIMAI